MINKKVFIGLVPSFVYVIHGSIKNLFCQQFTVSLPCTPKVYHLVYHLLWLPCSKHTLFVYTRGKFETEKLLKEGKHGKHGKHMSLLILNIVVYLIVYHLYYDEDGKLLWGKVLRVFKIVMYTIYYSRVCIEPYEIVDNINRRNISW